MIFVIWAIIFVIGIWIISTYNGLTALRLRIQNAWRQIDVQLKRRYDLIPNLVETVKGYMQYEQDTLQKVIDARSQAMAAKGVKESAEAQTALTQSLGKVFALMENYPELKASKNVSDLQEELTTTENQSPSRASITTIWSRNIIPSSKSFRRTCSPVYSALNPASSSKSRRRRRHCRA